MTADNDKRMLKELNHEMDQLLYAISHDLRAPLRSIDGFSQAVVEDYADLLDEEGKDYLARVRSSAMKINEYVEGLLTISRQSRGDLIIEEADLSTIAREVGEQLISEYPEHHPEFIVKEGITVAMDRRLARFFLEKLLGNCWKFTSKTSEARIEFGQTKVDGKQTCFVRDNGAGFDMQYAGDRLFGAFQRMHTDDQFPGLGVGLATAKRIMNRHGGCIWAESEPDQGTTIYFITDTV